jgi:hypothetical protein
MGILDRFKPHIEKAKEKAQDPAFQARIKEAAQRQMQQRRQQQQGRPPVPGQRSAFTGGNVGDPGYPFMPGHPLYGQYAYPGFYDSQGQWYDQDSDGDGVPDSQDAAPNDPNVQTADQIDPGAQYGDQDQGTYNDTAPDQDVGDADDVAAGTDVQPDAGYQDSSGFDEVPTEPAPDPGGGYTEPAPSANPDYGSSGGGYDSGGSSYDSGGGGFDSGGGGDSGGGF